MQQVWKKLKKLILDPVKNGSELEIHQEIGSNIIHLLNVERFNVIRQLFVNALHMHNTLYVGLTKARFPLSELTARVDGWPVSIARQHGPSWRAVNSANETRARQHGPCWRVMETGQLGPLTRAVNSGSGNRA